MKRLLANNRALLLAWSCAVACAQLPPSDDGESLEWTSASTVTILPTTPQPVAGQAGSSTTASPTAQTAVDAVGKASAVRGMSLRWHANKSRCMSRTRAAVTVNDPIVMAACASDARQAFAMSSLGQINIDHNFCVGQGKGATSLSVSPCVDGNSKIWMVFSNTGSSTFLSSASGPMAPSDPQGAVGTAIAIKTNSAAAGADSVWDFVGVGNVGGTAWALTGNAIPSQCLSVANGAPVLAACNSAQAEQRWRWDGGLFVNDTGKCLDCDTPGLACTLKTCSAVPSVQANVHVWRYLLAYLRFSADDGNSYSLRGHPDTATVSVIEPNGTSFDIGFVP